MDTRKYRLVPCPAGYENCEVEHWMERDVMLTADVDIDLVPEFVRGHKTVRTDIGDDSQVLPAYGGYTEWVDRPIEEANLITSIAEDYPWAQYHRPILDLDFNAALVPSSTPGHFHLYLDKMLLWGEYLNLLKALAEAGIIQYGFVEGAERRGATSARLPWIKKGDIRANMLDPDKKDRELREEREKLERRLAEINAQLAPLEIEIEDDDEVW